MDIKLLTIQNSGSYVIMHAHGIRQIAANIKNIDAGQMLCSVEGPAADLARSGLSVCIEERKQGKN